MLPQVLEKVLRARGLQVGTPQKLEGVRHVYRSVAPPHAHVEHTVLGVYRIRALPMQEKAGAGEWYYVWRTAVGWFVSKIRPTEIIERGLGVHYYDLPRTQVNF